MNLVSCSDCRLFIADTIGDGTGLGKCHAYEDYKAKKPSLKALDAAYKQLGSKLFWCGSRLGHAGNRICSKYIK